MSHGPEHNFYSNEELQAIDKMPPEEQQAFGQLQELGVEEMKEEFQFKLDSKTALVCSLVVFVEGNHIAHGIMGHGHGEGHDTGHGEHGLDMADNHGHGIAEKAIDHVLENMHDSGVESSDVHALAEHMGESAEGMHLGDLADGLEHYAEESGDHGAHGEEAKHKEELDAHVHEHVATSPKEVLAEAQRIQKTARGIFEKIFDENKPLDDYLVFNKKVQVLEMLTSPNKFFNEHIKDFEEHRLTNEEFKTVLLHLLENENFVSEGIANNIEVDGKSLAIVADEKELFGGHDASKLINFLLQGEGGLEGKNPDQVLGEIATMHPTQVLEIADQLPADKQNEIFQGALEGLTAKQADNYTSREEMIGKIIISDPELAFDFHEKMRAEGADVEQVTNVDLEVNADNFDDFLQVFYGQENITKQMEDDFLGQVAEKNTEQQKRYLITYLIKKMKKNESGMSNQDLLANYKQLEERNLIDLVEACKQVKDVENIDQATVQNIATVATNKTQAQTSQVTAKRADEYQSNLAA